MLHFVSSLFYLYSAHFTLCSTCCQYAAIFKALIARRLLSCLMKYKSFLWQFTRFAFSHISVSILVFILRFTYVKWWSCYISVSNRGWTTMWCHHPWPNSFDGWSREQQCTGCLAKDTSPISAFAMIATGKYSPPSSEIREALSRPNWRLIDHQANNIWKT